MGAATTDLMAVPIAKVGSWQTSTGPWECTESQLADAVAAQRDPAFRAAVLKIGHTDPRFNDPDHDGEPAIGHIRNLRLSGNRQTLLSDWFGVPTWLADVMASAYPSRSVECWLGVQSPVTGVTYEMAVTAVSLLGVTAPAIESLEDIAELFKVPTDVGSYVAARRIAAAFPMEAPVPITTTTTLPVPTTTVGDPTPPRRHTAPDPVRLAASRALTVEAATARGVKASASINELMSAYERWAAEQPDLGSWTYCRDVFTDTVIGANYDDDDETTYWQSTWTEADGEFTFGDPVQVRPTWEPVPARKAASMGGTGPGTATIDAPDTSSQTARHVNPDPLPSVRGAGGVDTTNPEDALASLPTRLAQALGLPADADEDAALAALEAALKAPTDAGDNPADSDDDGEKADDAAPDDAAPEPPVEDDPAAPADVQELVAAAVKRAEDRIRAAYGPELQAATTELAKIKAKEAATVRASVLDSAIADGKITPADRGTWEQRYDAAPDVTTSVLADIRAGSAFPTHPAGHADPGATTKEPEAYLAVYGHLKKGDR